MTHQRYAIYAAPEGDLWDAGSRWLGWDALRGAAVAQPEVAGLDPPLSDLTATARRYGFHATIKPPFHLAAGTSPADLVWATEALCLRLAPVRLPGLRVARIGDFLALVAEGDAGPLTDLAGRVVEALDPFRAPLTPANIARRAPAALTPRQRVLLDLWGYPYVMEEFLFHLTLSDRLTEDQARVLQAGVARHLAPHLPRPFVLDSLCLCGQADDGRFHILQRFALSG